MMFWTQKMTEKNPQHVTEMEPRAFCLAMQPGSVDIFLRLWRRADFNQEPDRLPSACALALHRAA